jgi:hypothetical protein
MTSQTRISVFGVAYNEEKYELVISSLLLFDAKHTIERKRFQSSEETTNESNYGQSPM